MRHSGLALLTLFGVGLAVSCSRDSPVELLVQPPEVPTETAAGKKAPNPRPDGSALSIEDMLADPLFQALVQAIDEPTLSEPLTAAVNALASGQTARATRLIGLADAAAIALEDGPVNEALIFWSAIVRFLEEAELS